MGARRWLTVLALGCSALAASPQVHDALASYEDYKRGVMGRYGEYRSKVLSEYSTYLDGVWRRFDEFVGQHRDSVPKPKVPDIYKPGGDTHQPSELPVVRYSGAATQSQEQRPNVKTQVRPVAGRIEKTVVDFFGLPVEVSAPEFVIDHELAGMQAYGRHWRQLDEQRVAELVVPRILAVSAEMNLNDYLTYCLVRDFVNTRFGGCAASSRLATIHYIMANAGYDMRVAVDNHHTPLLLVNSSQTVYERPYLMVQGSRYYIFGDEDRYESTPGREIYTCVLPVDTDQGRQMDFRVGNLVLPYTPHPYEIIDGEIRIAGECNRNLYAMLYRYPQIQIDGYAESCPDQRVRDEVASQFREALYGKDKHEALDRLLHFMHYAFEYATDEDRHGFEKPYFFEEMLYYDQNDCEDRALFFAYLAWEVLGVKCHLISYPGHESVAVDLGEPIIDGSGYRSGDIIYYLADPTYIGSVTGTYNDYYSPLTPTIDYRYPAE